MRLLFPVRTIGRSMARHAGLRRDRGHRSPDCATARDPAPPSSITIRDRARVVVVPFEEIQWIEAEDNYVLVHTATRSYTAREKSRRDREADRRRGVPARVSFGDRAARRGAGSPAADARRLRARLGGRRGRARIALTAQGAGGVYGLVAETRPLLQVTGEPIGRPMWHRHSCLCRVSARLKIASSQRQAAPAGAQTRVSVPHRPPLAVDINATASPAGTPPRSRA
jgi:hypothetical protein